MTLQQLSALAVLSVHHKKAMQVPHDSVVYLFADLGDCQIRLH